MGCGNSNLKQENYLLEVLGDHEDAVNCFAVCEDGSILASASEDKTIRMWSTQTKEIECLGVLRGHTAYVTCLTTSDMYVISGSADNTIRKWDMTTCECLVKYTGHTSRISRVSCNGDVIFSTSYDKTARIWDFDPDIDEDEIEWNKSIATLTGHTRGVYPLVFIPGYESTRKNDEAPLFGINDILITGSADCTARVWSLESKDTITILRGHRGPITCMSLGPESLHLYTGSADKSIRSWDYKAGICLKVMEGHEHPVVCLIVVNRLMYSGGQDGKARCWVREFGDCMRAYKGHTHSITSIIFSDGIIYTASGDTTIRAYDAKTGVLKRIFTGHDAAVTSIRIVGEKLFSGSFDSTIRVWSIKNIKHDEVIESDNEEEEEEVQETKKAKKFRKKQEKCLDDLDTQLNGYMKNDVDIDSVPAN